jgi:hypothetical protein
MIQKNKIYSHENQISRNAFVQFFKWLVLLITYCFLAYKLYTFEHYDAFLQHFQHPSLSQFFWLLVVFALLPLNIFLETVKWQKIIEKTEQIPFRQALNAVLAGFAAGFATPNRIGDMAGRMLFISPANRKITAIYSLLNSFTQNYSIAIAGLPAAVCYFLIIKNNTFDFQKPFIVAVIAFIVFITTIYFFLPKIVFLFNKYNRLQSLTSVSDYKVNDLLSITGYSVFRFIVFSIQFFAVLQFFGVELSLFEALVSIPTSYLFVTFTPSLAFSEAAIRSSYAVLIIGAFSDKVAGIAFAGFLLWVINFVLPMLIGSRLIVNTK